MTSLKNKKIRTFLLFGLGVLIIFLVIVISENSCGIKHITILNDIGTFEKTLDPEFCEDVLEKIDNFNLMCQPQIEILDCG